MKKIICVLMSMLIMSSASFAQNQPAKPATKKANATAPAAKQVAAKPAPTPKLKKDGTPDKRFKENKVAAKPAGPTKKDGTPDKRHKANKAAVTAAPKKN